MSTKRAKLNQFIDFEASEDNEKNLSSDDEESLDDFVLEETFGNTIDDEESRYQRFDLDDINEDEEREVAEAVARAKQRAAERGSGTVSLEETPDISQRSERDLHPVLTNFNLSTHKVWELTVKRGSEARLVKNLNAEYELLRRKDEKHLSDYDNNGRLIPPLFKFEAFCVKDLHRRIFVATDDLKTAATKLSWYITDKTIFNNVVLIDLPEGTLRGFGNNLLAYFRKQASSDPDIQRHQWVRISTGLYRGDLAMVIDPQPERLRLVVIPRFDQVAYINNVIGLEPGPTNSVAKSGPVLLSGQKRKRRLPPAVLGENVWHHLKSRGRYRIYGKRHFLDRLEVIQGKSTKVDLRPTLNDSEIQPFTDIDLCREATSDYIRQSRQDDWRPGDQAYVLRGGYAGLIGIIQELNTYDHSVTLQFELDENLSEGELMATLEWDDIRRHFPVGKWVRVVWGIDKGRIGVVVEETSRTKGFIKLLSHVNNQSKPEEFTAIQDYLEEFADAPSYEGLRHPYAPGTVASSQKGTEKGREHDLRHSPQQPGPIVPAAIPRHPDPRDPRIGKAVCIIGKTLLKGYEGYISDVGRSGVKISLPTRFPPYVTVKLNEAVCLDQPDRNMAGQLLKVPLNVLQKNVPILPPTPRPRTPEADVIPGDATASHEVDLREGAFLMDPAIGRYGDCHIFVKFQLSFENGSWEKRIGWTNKNPLLTIVESSTFDSSHGPQILVTVTDNHSSQKIQKLVSISHLKPAPPNKKGDDVLILGKGPSYGKQGKVLKLTRKNPSAEVDLQGTKETHSPADLCRITTTEPK